MYCHGGETDREVTGREYDLGTYVRQEKTVAGETVG